MSDNGSGGLVERWLPGRTEPDILKDDGYDLLRNDRRRYAIEHLADTRRESKRGLAEAVAARERRTTVDDLDRSTYKSVYNAFHQGHLERMDGVAARYDEDDAEVAATQGTGLLNRYITGTADILGDHLDAGLGPGDVFGVLASPHRRAVMRYVRDIDRELDVPSIAQNYVAETEDIPFDEVERDDYSTVHPLFIQTHLPKLDEADAVDYDRDRSAVTAGPALPIFEPHLADGPSDPTAETMDPEFGVTTFTDRLRSLFA